MKLLEVKTELKKELNIWAFGSGWVTAAKLWIIGYINKLGCVSDLSQLYSLLELDWKLEIRLDTQASTEDQ